MATKKPDTVSDHIDAAELKIDTALHDLEVSSGARVVSIEIEEVKRNNTRRTVVNLAMSRRTLFDADRQIGPHFRTAPPAPPPPQQKVVERMSPSRTEQMIADLMKISAVETVAFTSAAVPPERVTFAMGYSTDRKRANCVVIVASWATDEECSSIAMRASAGIGNFGVVVWRP